MKERPILFSGPMVRAIIEGSKTQTRRIADVTDRDCRPGMITPNAGYTPRSLAEHASYCPYGQPGDRLWVRETWTQFAAKPDDLMKAQGVPDNAVIDFKADYTAVQLAATFDSDGDEMRTVRWRPSIHMPRWASRLTLEVAGVRVERLQDITEEDAIAEGAFDWWNSLDPHEQMRVYCGGNGPVAAFHALWDSINKDRAPWDSNPWVWVVSFQRVA